MTAQYQRALSYILPIDSQAIQNEKKSMKCRRYRQFHGFLSIFRVVQLFSSQLSPHYPSDRLTTRRTERKRLMKSKYNVRAPRIASSTLSRFMICWVSYKTKPEKMRTEKHAMKRSMLALNGRKIWTKDVMMIPINPANRNGPRKLKSH